jgi:peptidoglycan/xylan/chitin deacetylase (PgdA/CDA1 family)
VEAICFLFHDVKGENLTNSSGFDGPGSIKYKLSLLEFKEHLRAISQTAKIRPASIYNLLGDKILNPTFLLTFDDGGLSSYTIIADLLAELNWVGHFFITTDYINKPSFMNGHQIRALRSKGHIVGTHSLSHPERMSSLSYAELISQWNKSKEVLSDVLGEPVEIASVPGGYYSKKVAQAASACGIKALFTSEPVRKGVYVDNCLVLGRYSITKNMPAETSAALIKGFLWPRFKQFASWNTKKIFKILSGRFYLKLRNFLVK